MRGGFFSGVLLGTVVGTVTGMMMGPRYQKKAQHLMKEGQQMVKVAQSSVETAGNFMEKGRALFSGGQSEQKNDQMTMGQGPDETGKENINQRVAVLEKRLEELSQQGV